MMMMMEFIIFVSSETRLAKPLEYGLRGEKDDQEANQ